MWRSSCTFHKSLSMKNNKKDFLMIISLEFDVIIQSAHMDAIWQFHFAYVLMFNLKYIEYLRWKYWRSIYF